MKTEHKVTDGECIASLAIEYGVPRDAIWNDDTNAELRAQRADPYVLAEGDKVAIPDRESSKTEKAAINAATTFVLDRRAESLYLRFLDHLGQPRKQLKYLFEVDGDTRTGTTKSDGTIVEPVPPTLATAVVTLSDDEEEEEEYELWISALDPPDTPLGVQQRLLNLGHDLIDEFGAPASKTDAVLRDIQRANGLDETGDADPATVAAIEKAYRR